MHSDSCTNTHHDFTDLINHGMVKNIKTFNILRTENNFSMKQKNSSSVPQMTHLRGYRFAVEVTFNKHSCIFFLARAI